MKPETSGWETEVANSGFKGKERIEERIWWMFLIYWAIWTLIRQNYFRMLSAGPSQDVGLLPCPNLPEPMVARVHWLYIHNIQMCIPYINVRTRQTKAWTHRLHSGIVWDTFFSLFVKESCVAAPVFSLARRCSSDRCCVFLQSCVFTQTCVCKRERVGQCFRKHVYVYRFHLTHTHTLLNLAAVCDCLVLDDHSVGESSLL